MPDHKVTAQQAGGGDSVPGASRKLGRPQMKVIFALLAVALAARVAVFWLSVSTSMTLSIPNAENWQDFSLAYAPAVEAFKSGFLPYRDFFYPYPPPFLWSLTAFSYLPLPSWSSALSLVGADALTVVPLYLIAREVAAERTARLLAVLFVFSPLNLYYVDYLWLNPPLTTLFLLGSVSLLVKKRYGLSALSLALAIGLKQTALVAFPVVLLVMWRSGASRGEVFRYLALVVSVCVLFSLPYLVASPTLYLDSFFRVPWGYWPGVGPSYFQIGAGTGTQVTFDTANWLTSRWALLGAGVNGPATLILPLFLFAMPSSLLSEYGSQLLSDAGWFFLGVGLLILLIVARWRPGVSLADSWKYVLCAMLFAFSLYPFYKYYVVGVVPFLVLLVRDRKGALGFFGFSLALMLVPRYLGSWLLLATFAWLFRHDLAALVTRGVRAAFAPFGPAVAPPLGAEEEDDSVLYWEGRPVSQRALFGVAALGSFAVLLLMIWPRVAIWPGVGWGTLGFFVSGGASAAYLWRHGPGALGVNSRSMLWLGMLWGYDLPYMVIASLVFLGVLRL